MYTVDAVGAARPQIEASGGQAEKHLPSNCEYAEYVLQRTSRVVLHAAAQMKSITL